jgi:uncharacterized membrane protein
MKRPRLSLLAGSCLVAILTVATADFAVPQIVRIVLGVLIVFIVPGFALVCAVLPDRQFALGERLLASVGMSLAMATTLAVLLGATPIGLSRLSLAVVLGGCTLTLSTYAACRTCVVDNSSGRNEGTTKGIGS